jgi:hypothetical protein
MTWQLQDNPNLAPSIIERSHSFDESTRKPLAIIFASVALPETGKKYIFYLVRCDIVNNGVPDSAKSGPRPKSSRMKPPRRGARAPSVTATPEKFKSLRSPTSSLPARRSRFTLVSLLEAMLRCYALDPNSSVM